MGMNQRRMGLRDGAAESLGFDCERDMLKAMCRWGWSLRRIGHLLGEGHDTIAYRLTTYKLKTAFNDHKLWDRKELGRQARVIANSERGWRSGA